MSLAGFRAQNHPQQLAVRGPRPHVDDRETDPVLFTKLDERFHFSIDVAASIRNAKCPLFYTIDDNGLDHSWMGQRVWCNPPYSNIEPWIEKAWMECQWAEVIVMLLPANRTEQGWWQVNVEPYRDGRRRFPRLDVEFIAGRQRFIAHNATEIGPNERPPFGCCLLIWQATVPAGSAQEGGT